MSKNILVTGATSGVGRATAKVLAEKGYRLLLVARRIEMLEEVAEKLTTDTLIYSCDLADTASIKDIFEYARQNDFKLDGLVHSAGINVIEPIRTLEIDSLERVMQVNFYSFVELVKLFSLRKYSNNGASIVALSSLEVCCMTKGTSIYTTSKVALNTYVQIAAKELLGRRIRVNALMPAYIDTEMVRNHENIDFFKAALEEQQFEVIPPENIGDIIEFFLSNKAEYITGALLPISAGIFK